MPHDTDVSELQPSSVPIVFVYDRATTPDRLVFQLRLEACGEFAREQGWEIGGWFADSGDQALSYDNRPGLDALLHAMQQAPVDRPRFLLVHDWTRLSNDPAFQAGYARAVRLAGGHVRTVTGDADGRDSRRGCLGTLVRTP